MPNKVKKLYKRAKKGIRNIASPKKQHSKVPVKIQNPTAKVEKPDEKKQQAPEEQGLNRGISFRNSLKKMKNKIKSLRTETGEQKIKKDGIFKKFKKKIKKLNPIKSKKNKIIGSKKLAFLLSAGTIIAILPMFNLPAFPAVAITSACVFSINFIAVKTLKKAIKQHKAKTAAKPEKLKNVAFELAKKDPKQISKE